MAIAQVDYTLEFASGINRNGKNESPVIRMVVQHDDKVCYLKGKSFAQECAKKVCEVTGLIFTEKKVAVETYCLRTDAMNNYKYNKEVAEDLNNKYANQLRSELFGNNPSQVLYIFPDIFPEQTR
ncbi:MAG: hypothetical protein FGM23_03415 [Alphaproteobacteria bacterium]|nr:hypothetical protein [Alphaproteobacteria bacterium]